MISYGRSRFLCLYGLPGVLCRPICVLNPQTEGCDVRCWERRILKYAGVFSGVGLIQHWVRPTRVGCVLAINHPMSMRGIREQWLTFLRPSSEETVHKRTISPIARQILEPGTNPDEKLTMGNVPDLCLWILSKDLCCPHIRHSRRQPQGSNPSPDRLMPSNGSRPGTPGSRCFEQSKRDLVEGNDLVSL